MYFFPSYITYKESNGSLYIFSKLLQNEIKISDSAFIQEFQDLIAKGGRSTLSTSLTQFLHDQEFLVNSSEVEARLVEAKTLLDKKLLLTIMPTEGCNFRCPYCYESHNPVVMTEKLQNQICDYIAKQAPNFQEVHISWFGGEPTLRADIVLKISRFVQELQSKSSFQYRGGMTTNGYLLDENTFRQFYQVGIRDFQITLDGWKHDEKRPHVSGQGTLQRILNNLLSISKLPASEFQYHVTLRYNILNEDRDFSWHDYIYSLFGKDKRFVVSVAAVTDWGGDGVKSLGLAKQELKDIHNAYLDKIGMPRNKTGESLFSNICYASCKYGFIFRADGRIEKCTIALDNPHNLVGRVDADRGVVIDEPIALRWCRSNIQPECYTCPELLACLNLCCRKGIVVDNHADGGCVCKLTPKL